MRALGLRCYKHTGSSHQRARQSGPVDGASCTIQGGGSTAAPASQPDKKQKGGWQKKCAKLKMSFLLGMWGGGSAKGSSEQSQQPSSATSGNVAGGDHRCTGFWRVQHFLLGLTVKL